MGRERESTREFAGILFGGTIFQVALSMQSSIASPFFNDRGISPEQIGLLNSMNWGVISFASMPSGRLSDLIGRLGPFLFSSIFGAAACLLISVKADFSTASLLYLVMGLSVALFTPNASAFISEISESSKITFLFAIFYLVTLAGAAIGSVVSGWSSKNLWSESPFLFASILFLLSGVVYLVLFRRERRQSSRRSNLGAVVSSIDVRAMISTIRKSPRLGFYGFSLFFHALGFLMISPYVSLYSQKVVGLDISGVGLVIAAWNVGLVVGSLPWAWASTKRGSRYVLLGHFVLSSLSWLLFSFATDLTSAIVFGLILGIVGAMDLPARRTITVELAGNGRLGEAMGFIELINGMGGLFGAAIGGLIWERLGPTFPFYLAAMMTLISVPPVLVVIRDINNKDGKQN